MVDKKEVFEFLDEMRESGEINMFGAPRHVIETFGMTEKEAMDIVVEWMKGEKA